jgi:cell division protein FtsW
MVVTHNPAVDDGQEVVDRTELRKGRFKRFFAGVSPTDTINDDNRQVIFSKFALAHGGVIGCGPGNSRENARLPLAFSDYIFSIIIEDTGFVGGLFLLIMYLCLMGRAGQIAVKCRKAFPALLIMGCAVMIVLQALMHMSIVVGLVPVSGQPLPFISKGGTSVWVMSIAMGMMLSVSKFAVQSGKRQDEHTDLRQSVAESGEADNPTMVKPTDDKLTYN